MSEWEKDGHFSLNDEQKSNKVGVEHQPVNPQISKDHCEIDQLTIPMAYVWWTVIVSTSLVAL